MEVKSAVYVGRKNDAGYELVLVFNPSAAGWIISASKHDMLLENPYTFGLTLTHMTLLPEELGSSILSYINLSQVFLGMEYAALVSWFLLLRVLWNCAACSKLQRLAP